MTAATRKLEWEAWSGGMEPAAGTPDRSGGLAFASQGGEGTGFELGAP